MLRITLLIVDGIQLEIIALSINNNSMQIFYILLITQYTLSENSVIYEHANKKQPFDV